MIYIVDCIDLVDEDFNFRVNNSKMKYDLVCEMVMKHRVHVIDTTLSMTRGMRNRNDRDDRDGLRKRLEDGYLFIYDVNFSSKNAFAFLDKIKESKDFDGSILVIRNMNDIIKFVYQDAFAGMTTGMTTYIGHLDSGELKEAKEKISEFALTFLDFAGHFKRVVLFLNTQNIRFDVKGDRVRKFSSYEEFYELLETGRIRDFFESDWKKTDYTRLSLDNFVKFMSSGEFFR